MILYRLRCANGHTFESWFRDGAAFDDQSACGAIACPLCGSPHVGKAIMAPAVVGAPTDAESANSKVALVQDKDVELRRLLRSVRERVLTEGQDVGTRFSVEARRIHDGEAPERQIYGKATAEDVCDLLQDGILVLPIPVLPDEMN